MENLVKLESFTSISREWAEAPFQSINNIHKLLNNKKVVFAYSLNLQNFALKRD